MRYRLAHRNAPRWEVTVSATLGTGHIVRWYRSFADVARGDAAVTVSMDGVVVRETCSGPAGLQDLIDLLPVASRVLCQIRSGADVSGLATCLRSMGGEVVVAR